MMQSACTSSTPHIAIDQPLADPSTRKKEPVCHTSDEMIDSNAVGGLLSLLYGAMG
jgi:hypothetical protein